MKLPFERNNHDIKTSTYFPVLTGVRAIAAYLVFINHLPLDGKISELADVVMEGSNIGVAIFFVLSGFLISYRYSDSFKNSEANYFKYLLKRFARIYPLYLVITIFTLLYDKNWNFEVWLLNLTLLKSFFDIEIGTGIVQGWSLTIEEIFYLSAPLLFLAFRKAGFFTVLFIIIIGIILVMISQEMQFVSFMKTYELMMYFTFFGRCFEFYCGYKLAEAIKNNTYINKSNFIFTLSGTIFIICSILFLGFIYSQEYDTALPVSTRTLANNFIIPVIISVWFYGLITEKTIFQKLLSTKIFQVLGKSSYAFYLIHLGWFPEAIYFHVYPSIPAIFIFLNIWAIGIFYCFEEPINKFIIRKFTGRKLLQLANR